MKEPTFTADGYPTDDTLEEIENWEIKTAQDAIDVMEYVGMAWSYPKYWDVKRDVPNEWGRKEARYIFSTGGWSGNESLVGALENNVILNMLGAWSWQRGGHYEYRLREPSDE